jgi:outer membrane immunogenic protein
MNRSLPLAIAAVVAVAGAMSAQNSAYAADMPRAAPIYKAQPVAQAYDWTGFYLGINGGYAWGRSSWSDPAAGTDSGRFNTNGGTLGGQAGYNWQTGPAVIGIETDFNWINAKGSSSAGGVCLTDGAGQCQAKQTWIGTTRARLGYSFDRWLPYITGGVAYGDIRADQANGSSSTTKTGWTVGGGVEYGIDRNWSAKLEYLHIDLGTASFMGAASGTPTLSVPITDDIVRAGLNYRW